MKKTSTVCTSAVLAAIDAEKPERSHWGRAVQGDAHDLVSDLHAAGVEELPVSCADLDALMLNGAADWSSYSWAGCGLCYDEDIAERYCTPSELARCRGGLRRPNGSEEWLDVQARAMAQAARLVRATVRKVSDEIDRAAKEVA